MSETATSQPALGSQAQQGSAAMASGTVSGMASSQLEIARFVAAQRTLADAGWGDQALLAQAGNELYTASLVATTDPGSMAKRIGHALRLMKQATADVTGKSAPAAVAAALNCIGVPQRPAAAPGIFQQVVNDVTATPGAAGTAQLGTNSLVHPEVQIDPAQIWRETARLVPYAQSEVAIQTFGWDTHSDPAREFLHALLMLNARRKVTHATSPVNVRIMIDSMPSELNGNLSPDALRAELQAAVDALGLARNLVNVEIGLYEHSLGGSQHAKTAYIDNRIATVTGSNMNGSDDYEKGEHDAGFWYGGDMVKSVQRDYDDTWHKTQVSTKSDAGWQTGPARAATHDFSQVPTLQQALLNPRDPIDQKLGEMKPGVPTLVANKPANDDLLVGDKRPDHAIGRMMTSMIKHSSESYKFATANLNEPGLVEEIVNAALRRVKVQGIMTQGYEDVGQALSAGTNAATVREIHQRLVRGFTMYYQDRGLAEAQAHAMAEQDARTYFNFRWSRFDPSSATQDVGHQRRSSHVKYASADEQIAYNGSLNMDQQSYMRSREVGVLVGDAETVHTWNEQLFDRDFARGVPIGDYDSLPDTTMDNLLRSARFVEEGT